MKLVLTININILICIIDSAWSRPDSKQRHFSADQVEFSGNHSRHHSAASKRHFSADQAKISRGLSKLPEIILETTTGKMLKEKMASLDRLPHPDHHDGCREGGPTRPRRKSKSATLKRPKADHLLERAKLHYIIDHCQEESKALQRERDQLVATIMQERKQEVAISNRELRGIIHPRRDLLPPNKGAKNLGQLRPITR